MGQRRLTQDEISYARSICGGLLSLKNGGVDVDCVISVLNRIIENNTTDGFPYVEPKLTEDDVKNRRLVMVRDSDEYAEHGPQKLVAIEGDYFITSKVDGRGAASWRQCRPATKEEIKAAGLLTPEEIAKAKRLEDMVNAKWLGGGGMSDTKQLPVGTRIRFVKSIYGSASGDCPPCIYAEKDDGGVVTGHNCPEGHWVKWDHWPHAFGSEYGTEFIEEPQEVTQE